MALSFLEVLSFSKSDCLDFIALMSGPQFTQSTGLSGLTVLTQAAIEVQNSSWV